MEGADNRADRPDFRSPAYLRLGEVIPDHGHLMHLFLLRVPELDAMWHLHPDPIAEETHLPWTCPICPPAATKFSPMSSTRAAIPWTLVGSIDLPQITAGKPLAGDDSAWSGGAAGCVGRLIPQTRRLPDGGRIVWQRPAGTLKAGVPMEFTFAVQDKNGRPAQDMEPYMGMAGHAEFVRSDLSVFAHVHPAGSVSMAALELAQAGLPGSCGLRTNAHVDAHARCPCRCPTPARFRRKCASRTGFPSPATIAFCSGKARRPRRNWRLRRACGERDLSGACFSLWIFD